MQIKARARSVPRHMTNMMREPRSEATQRCVGWGSSTERWSGFMYLVIAEFMAMKEWMKLLEGLHQAKYQNFFLVILRIIKLKIFLILNCLLARQERNLNPALLKLVTI